MDCLNKFDSLGNKTDLDHTPSLPKNKDYKSLHLREPNKSFEINFIITVKKNDTLK